MCRQINTLHPCGRLLPALAPPPATTLVDLRRRAAHGDRAALDQLLLQVQPGVHRYLFRRLPPRPDRDDVAHDLRQEVLIRAVAALDRGSFENDRRLVTWLLVIARNVLMDYYRAERGRPESLPAGALEALAEGVSLDEWRRGEPPRAAGVLERVASEAMRGLPERTQELLRLRVQLGRPWSEVGAALGTTATGAKRRFQRAQAALRRRFLAAVAALPPAERARVEACVRGRLT